MLKMGINSYGQDLQGSFFRYWASFSVFTPSVSCLPLQSDFMLPPFTMCPSSWSLLCMTPCLMLGMKRGYSANRSWIPSQWWYWMSWSDQCDVLCLLGRTVTFQLIDWHEKDTDAGMGSALRRYKNAKAAFYKCQEREDRVKGLPRRGVYSAFSN